MPDSKPMVIGDQASSLAPEEILENLAGFRRTANHERQHAELDVPQDPKLRDVIGETMHDISPAESTRL